MRTKRKRQMFLIGAVLLTGALIMVMPFVWMLLTSLKTEREAMQIPPALAQTHYRRKFRHAVRTPEF